MTIPAETHHQEKTPRRYKRLFLLLLSAAAGCFVVIGALCFYITQPIIGSHSSKNSPAVDPHRLESHVRVLSETLIFRDASHPDNLDRAAKYIRQQFERTRGRVTDQPFEVNGTTYRNVVISFGPETLERVVVGAHYDAAGPYPGADDNASGVAGLIELAYLMNKSEFPLAVELVAYPLEEPPYFRTDHMGSAVHARALKMANARVRAMFSLEMIGYFSDAPDSQHFPNVLFRLFYPSAGNFICVVGTMGQGGLVREIKQAMSDATSLPVYSINAPRSLRGVDFSDHRNYWDQGYPAVMITDLAFYRNPNYHTVNDTAEKIDYARLAQVVEGVYASLKALTQ